MDGTSEAIRKSPPSREAAIRAIVLLAVLLGTALRLYRLDFQSLWYDEAFSLAAARQSVAGLTELLARYENHPPLHFYLLHVWTSLAGQSEFAVRFLSVLFGVLAIPALYVVGRALLGRGTACLAVLLAALSPVHVQHSQEARMYSLVTLLSLLSAYALLRALRDNRPAAWAGFALAALLALYSHYYAALILAFEVLFALCWLLAQKSSHSSSLSEALVCKDTATADGVVRRGRFGRGAGGVGQTGQRAGFHPLVLAVLAIALGYLPWLGVPLGQYGSVKNYYPGSMDFQRVARETLEIVWSGRLGPPEQTATFSWALALLAVVGWLSLRARPGLTPFWARLFLGLYLLLPIALLVVILTQRPKFGPQYLLIVWPAFSLLLASGLLAPLRLGGKRGAGAAALLFVAVLGMAVSFLSNYFHDPVYARDDWRAVAGFVRSQQGPEDTVLLLAGYVAPALRYYYGADGWQPVHPSPVMSLDEVVDYAEAALLMETLAGRRRVWLVRWQAEVTDPNGLINGLLSRAAGPPALARQFGTIGVERYDLPEGSAWAVDARPAVAHEVDFGDRVQLLGYDLASLVVPSGGTAALSLYWQALRPLEDDYYVSARLVDAAGREWGRSNKRPAGTDYYTQRWQVGSLVKGGILLPVSPGTPPGSYELRLSLFSGATMKDLDVLQSGIPVGTTAPLVTLEVAPASTPPSYAELGLAAPQPSPVAPGVLLLGGRLPGDALAPGGRLDLSLWWEAAGTSRPDLRLELLIRDATQTELARLLAPPAGDTYPTNRWRDGERLRGQHSLVVPAQARGPILIAGRLRDANGAPAGDEFLLGELPLLDRARNTTRPPAPQFARRVVLGDAIALLGYDVDRREARSGDSISLRLYWQAIATPSHSYKVFTHLLDKDQRLWAQEDGFPGRGALPTSGWVPGEYIADDYVLKVKPEAPPGEYLIEVGIYLETTGERLPAFDESGAPLGEQVVFLEVIRIGR